jgi:hypothetical protein
MTKPAPSEPAAAILSGKLGDELIPMRARCLQSTQTVAH